VEGRHHVRSSDLVEVIAKTIGKLSDEVMESIGIFHSFRNKVYHIGVLHEAVLPVIAAFYFKVACEFLSRYSPSWIGYSPGMELPERARKFFVGQRFHIDCSEQYQKACKKLGPSRALRRFRISRTIG
jgi:hypothetical protein